MARTTPELVRGIVETDGTTDLEPFILAAESLVTEVCEPAGYSDERLELIERWLSAHFYQIFDTPTSSEKAGSVSESKQYHIELGLNQTRYGQQAMLLDTKGGLRSVNSGKRRVVGAFWLGTEN